MEFNIIKETCIEYCENMYALGSNFLKSNSKLELVNILNKIDDIEDKVRKCNDVNRLFDYKKMLELIMNRLEGIINA